LKVAASNPLRETSYVFRLARLQKLKVAASNPLRETSYVFPTVPRDEFGLISNAAYDMLKGGNDLMTVQYYPETDMLYIEHTPLRYLLNNSSPKKLARQVA